MDLELEKRLAKLERLALLAGKNVFNVDDLALYLGISPRTVYNKMDQLPHYKNIDGRVFFKRSEIEEWQTGESFAVKHTPIPV